MASWFARKFDKWAAKSQTEQMSEFITGLRSADGEELGLVVAIATHLRNGMEEKGLIISDPIVFTSTHPYFTYEMSKTVIKLQKEGKLQLAAGWMVWVHTLRAGTRLELRQFGRDMWRELARGFPHVETAAITWGALQGVELDTRGAAEFPKGLTPDPT
jgi:hypothetical protein